MQTKAQKMIMLFWSFFKIGLFTFGGGYAMIPLIEKETVTKRHWVSEEDIFEIILVAESTPGPISINAATYIGYKVAGIPGALFANFGLILPSFVILFTISLFLEDFLSLEIVSKAFLGIKAAIALLILNAGIKFTKQIKNEPVSIILSLLIIVLMILSEIFAWHISSILLIVSGAFFGFILYGLLPKLSKKGGEKL